MSKYIKKFSNHADYEAAESGLILPNVSLCVNENEVHYNPSTPPAPSHDYVEIGGIKWATMNVGANSITDTGLYFQWADTQGYTAAQVGSGEGQKYFGWDDAKYKGPYEYEAVDHYTKYNSTDELAILEASDDAVTAAWGGNWRMPTTAEFIALSNSTTCERVDNYEGIGVSGCLFTSKDDSSKKLFFPLNGYLFEGEIGGSDYSYIWSSNLDYSCNNGAYAIDMYNEIIPAPHYRYEGLPVRGVLDL